MSPKREKASRAKGKAMEAAAQEEAAAAEKQREEKANSFRLSSVATMNKRTKAAAVLIALGTSPASEVVKYLHENEVETLSAEIAQIKSLTAEEKEDIINEFYEMCIAQKAITEGGTDYARSVLDKAFGEKKADELIFRATTKIDSAPFAFINDVDNKNLLMTLQHEHPQTIAVVLSHVSSDKASKIISELPREQQIEIIERISNMDKANPEITAIVERSLKKKLSGTYNTSSSSAPEHGGVQYIAEIMNRIDKDSQKAVFEGMEVTNPELVGKIKKLMFVFGDIINLNDMEIQAFIREADTKDLTVSLKAASPELQERIFNNMSSRQKEMIQSDMQYLHNLRMRDVEAAQQRIIDVIRGLEESGDIVLFKGGDDEIIA
ncbi:flagellar motor switch protein FliG [Ruminococcus sp. NK3A76]|uniref:flagellar motor switch protein FliG n=1 Tax=Ruminococcus sp. NK3A76 TaxID=877411 RepID=UPI000A5E5515|nr:flagellar motor switch protein FliG [Ruminococcus sp. NK3A76]